MTPAKAHMPFPPHLQWSGTDTPQQKVYHDIIMKKTSQVEDQHQNGRTLATYWGGCKHSQNTFSFQEMEGESCNIPGSYQLPRMVEYKEVEFIFYNPRDSML